MIYAGGIKKEQGIVSKKILGVALKSSSGGSSHEEPLPTPEPVQSLGWIDKIESFNLPTGMTDEYFMDFLVKSYNYVKNGLTGELPDYFKVDGYKYAKINFKEPVKLEYAYYKWWGKSTGIEISYSNGKSRSLGSSSSVDKDLKSDVRVIDGTTYVKLENSNKYWPARVYYLTFTEIGDE